MDNEWTLEEWKEYRAEYKRTHKTITIYICSHCLPKHFLTNIKLVSEEHYKLTGHAVGDYLLQIFSGAGK